jgi:hypothetical protein
MASLNLILRSLRLAGGIAVLGLVTSCPDSNRTATESPTPSNPAPQVTIAAISPSSSPSLPALSPDIPFDVSVVEKNPNLESLQHDFDVLSWNTFVALNWPAKADGQPDTGTQIGQNKDAPTVWQSWKEAYEIFLPGGATPPPWGTPHAAPTDWPPACKALFKDGMTLLNQVGKTPNLLSDTTEPFKTGPLIDQNGRYARFEIVVNKPMFDAIVANKLYSKDGQRSAAKVVFPCGSANPAPGSVGAIMVKASWKILNDDEKKSGRFHVIEAVVYTPPSSNPPVVEKCEVMTLGLVGMHIVHKTGSAPQWVWSTFEHVDNCPTQGETPSKPRYNFFNKTSPAPSPNEPPPRPWDPNKTEPPDRRVQVVRNIPIPSPEKVLTTLYHAALRKVNPDSVWLNYELVNTQWPTNPAAGCDVETSAPVDRIGTPAPQFLGNTTLETYIQGQVPNVSSSCMECHANATTYTSQRPGNIPIFSDFTFLLERAQ